MKKNNFFTSVPAPRVPRNSFDLSHEVKMSGKFGYLYPILTMEVMPGDTISDHIVAQVRAAPMLAPIMHQVKIKIDAFMVPYRLLGGETWETFATGGQDGSTNVVLPYITPISVGIVGGILPEVFGKGSLWDYLGGPVLEGAVPGTLSNEQLNVYPFQSYVKIWNDWFRDPNLEDELDFIVGVQGDVTNDFIADGWWQLRRRGWERESFTSALPWPQRGPDVLMPIAGTGSVTYKDNSEYYKVDGSAPSGGAVQFTPGTFFGELYATADGAPGPGNPSTTRVENIDTVNLTASSVTMNDFRAALAMQRWMEINSRSGGRYIEQIQGQYDQRVPDYRLQRSEYLGGGRFSLTISEVLSTADTATVPVGDMAGHGIAVGKSNGFSYRCQEHGIVMVIMSIVPTPAYMQGLPKLWSKRNRFDDLAFPVLANLGEQEVKSKEVYYSFDGTDDDGNDSLWGYNPRYYQYKFMQDRVSGDFRDTLLFWHLSRKFQARPTLNAEFVTVDDQAPNEEPMDRIFAVQDGTDYFWMQLFHRLHCVRPLSYYGVPTLIG